MKIWPILLLAFIVQLTDGRQVKVPLAVGFVQVEVAGIACHGFFDAAGQPLLAIPSSLITGAHYERDDKNL